MKEEKKNKKAKIIIVLIVVVILIGLTPIIFNNNIIIESQNKKTLPIQYSNLTEDSNLTEALDGYYSRIHQAENESDKMKLLVELQDYVLSDLQGYYYFRETDSGYGSDYMRNKYPEMLTYEKDDRAIYVKNKDEVYIFPYSEEYMKENNIDITSFDTLENSNLYKYRIINLETSDRDGAYLAYKSATIELQSYYINEKYGDTANKCYTTIKMKYFTSDGNYEVTGYFADMITENDNITEYKNNLKNGFGSYRTYYRDLNVAKQKDNENLKRVAAEEAEKDKLEQEKDKLKMSIPKVGMTPSEVRQTKWGSPDKINKDTYSWGTTEQWVYNKYGYVYFRDGKVSSISERYKSAID